MSDYKANYKAYTDNSLRPTDNPSYKAFLENLVANSDTILINVDSAMKGSFEETVASLVPGLRRFGKGITVLQPVMSELRYRTTSVDPHEREKATRAIAGLNALAQAGIVKFRGNPSEASTGSAAIIRYVMRNVFDEQITVITQDSRISEDLKIFGQIRSTRMNHIPQVKRISSMYGQLNNFSDTPTVSTNQQITRRTELATNSNAADILKRYGL